MTKVKILKPDIDLIKKDEYYLFYEMMMQALRTDNVKEGVNKTLYLLRVFLESQNIVLFRKNSKGIYVYKDSDSPMQNLLKMISSLVNKNKVKIEKNVFFDTRFEFVEEAEDIKFIYITFEDRKCILVIRDYNKNKVIDTYFWEKVRETLQIIIKRAVSYEKNKMAITTDMLTGLKNRNSYEKRVKKIADEKKDIVFVIFDLFRLKYINDNYSHAKGDDYIKETAKILSKYWPSYLIKYNADGTERFIKTGHYVYRVGGDEFVLLTTAETLEETKAKAKRASIEAREINLNIDPKPPVGINFGVVKHEKGGYIKDTFMNADKELSEDKMNMYAKYGIERRS